MKQKTNHTASTDGCLQVNIDTTSHVYNVPTVQLCALLERANISKAILARYVTGRSSLTVAEVVSILKDEIFADIRADIYLAIIEAICAYEGCADDEARTTSEYISIKEFAGRTNLCRASIEKYIHTGKLEAVRLGRSYRIHKDVLNRWQGACDNRKKV